MPPSITPYDEAARDELQRIATHVLARGQLPSTGRIGLRVSPGGFASIVFGADDERLRVSGLTLVRESAAGSSARAMRIDGADLAQLAEFAGVDLTAELSVGHDTPPVGDPQRPIELDRQAARRIATWFDLTAQALDHVLQAAPAWSEPSIPQLWPEHFDLAIDLAFDASVPAERRVNLGGAAGDGYHAAPYLYVGPWTPDRPGGDGYWNAPFGATLDIDAVMASDDPVATATRFFDTGLALLAP